MTAETVFPDDELHARALRALQSVVHLGDPIQLQFWETHGLTMPQVRLMVLLAERDNQKLGALARQLDVSPAAVTGLIDRLSRLDLIERRQDPDDRRVIRAALTGQGERVTRESLDVGRAYFNTIFDSMGKQRVRTFITVLTEFLEAASSVSVDEFLSSEPGGEAGPAAALGARSAGDDSV